jgi:hypothetical protein
MTVKREDNTFRNFLRAQSEDELLWALETGSPELQRKICFEIGRRKLRRAVSILCRLLRITDDEKVRAAAADALGEIGDPTAGEDLIAVFRDSSQPFQVRDTCAYALARLGYKPALLHLLPGLADPNRTVRLCVLAALAAINDPIAYEYVHLASEAEQDAKVKDEMQALLKRHPRREEHRLTFINTNIFLGLSTKWMTFSGVFQPCVFSETEVSSTGKMGPLTSNSSIATAGSRILLPKLPVSEETELLFQRLAA